MLFYYCIFPCHVHLLYFSYKYFEFFHIFPNNAEYRMLWFIYLDIYLCSLEVTSDHIFNSFSESDPEDEIPEAHSVLSLVTEVWIEPQHGYATNNPPERAAYDGCTFSTWPEKVRQL